MPVEIHPKAIAMEVVPSAYPPGTLSDVILEPTDHDVILGRGVFLRDSNSISSLPGNVNFRRICWGFKAAYLKAAHNEKTTIARQVMKAVASLQPPGRFIEEDEQQGYYVFVSERRAVEKCCQLLREKCKSPPGMGALPSMKNEFARRRKGCRNRKPAFKYSHNILGDSSNSDEEWTESFARKSRASKRLKKRGKKKGMEKKTCTTTITDDKALEEAVEAVAEVKQTLHSKKKKSAVKGKKTFVKKRTGENATIAKTPRETPTEDGKKPAAESEEEILLEAVQISSKSDNCMDDDSALDDNKVVAATAPSKNYKKTTKKAKKAPKKAKKTTKKAPKKAKKTTKKAKMHVVETDLGNPPRRSLRAIMSKSKKEEEAARNKAKSDFEYIFSSDSEYEYEPDETKAAPTELAPNPSESFLGFLSSVCEDEESEANAGTKESDASEPAPSSTDAPELAPVASESFLGFLTSVAEDEKETQAEDVTPCTPAPLPAELPELAVGTSDSFLDFIPSMADGDRQPTRTTAKVVASTTPAPITDTPRESSSDPVTPDTFMDFNPPTEPVIAFEHEEGPTLPPLDNEDGTAKALQPPRAMLPHFSGLSFKAGATIAMLQENVDDDFFEKELEGITPPPLTSFSSHGVSFGSVEFIGNSVKERDSPHGVDDEIPDPPTLKPFNSLYVEGMDAETTVTIGGNSKMSPEIFEEEATAPRGLVTPSRTH